MTLITGIRHLELLLCMNTHTGRLAKPIDARRRINTDLLIKNHIHTHPCTHSHTRTHTHTHTHAHTRTHTVTHTHTHSPGATAFAHQGVKQVHTFTLFCHACFCQYAENHDSTTRTHTHTHTHTHIHTHTQP